MVCLFWDSLSQTSLFNPAQLETKKKLNLGLKLSQEAVNTQSSHALVIHHSNYNVTENGCIDTSNKTDENEKVVSCNIVEEIFKLCSRPCAWVIRLVVPKTPIMVTSQRQDMNSSTLLWHVVLQSSIFILQSTNLCFSRWSNNRIFAHPCPFLITCTKTDSWLTLIQLHCEMSQTQDKRLLRSVMT